MKTSLKRHSRTNGSALIVGLIFAFVLCLSLLSYLALVYQQNVSVARSQDWNAALVHAEAGVEEALAQLNFRFGDTNVADRALNGWGGPNNGFFGPPGPGGYRQLSSGSYAVIINSDPAPLIYSTGYTTVPISGSILSRVVEVRAATAMAFQLGMAAKLDITFKGNNVHIDSFDSSDPNKSTGGMYDPAKAQANGDIASTDGLVAVQNADVNGKIRTGPSGTYSFNSGYAGPIGWTGPGLYSPDWYRNDFNYDFKDVTPPDTTGWLPFPAPVKANGTNTYVLSGNYYVNGDAPFKSGDIVLVATDTKIYVTGNFQMSGGNSQLNIANGASCAIYVGTTSGPDVSATFVAVNNSSGNAANFAYYGLPSNKSVTWNGNDAYVGTVYAPEATFSMGGGGNNVYDYQGACVVYEAVLNGHFNFHYDENLKKRGPVFGYTVGSWREL